MPKRIVLYGSHDSGKKDSSRCLSIRGLVAVIVVLGLSGLILHFMGGFYYEPICRRYAESERLTYDGYTMGWGKKYSPAECFFRDRRGNSIRVVVSTITLTPADWIRWILRWGATIVGVGASVWLVSFLIGSRPGRRRRKHD